MHYQTSDTDLGLCSSCGQKCSALYEVTEEPHPYGEALVWETCWIPVGSTCCQAPITDEEGNEVNA